MRVLPASIHRIPQSSSRSWTLRCKISLALVPLVSGHAAFFVYILGTAQQRETRALSGIALIAASVIKLWAWHDWPSLVAGGLVGAGAAWFFRRLDAAHATAIED